MGVLLLGRLLDVWPIRRKWALKGGLRKSKLILPFSVRGYTEDLHNRHFGTDKDFFKL